MKYREYTVDPRASTQLPRRSGARAPLCAPHSQHGAVEKVSTDRSISAVLNFLLPLILSPLPRISPRHRLTFTTLDPQPTLSTVTEDLVHTSFSLVTGTTRTAPSRKTRAGETSGKAFPFAHVSQKNLIPSPFETHNYHNAVTAAVRKPRS